MRFSFHKHTPETTTGKVGSLKILILYVCSKPVKRFLMMLLGYLLFGLLRLAPLCFVSLLWFRHRIHLLFNQINCPVVGKSSGNVEAVLFCKDVKNAQLKKSRTHTNIKEGKIATINPVYMLVKLPTPTA